jgi:hypothetical protein
LLQNYCKILTVCATFILLGGGETPLAKAAYNVSSFSELTKMKRIIFALMVLGLAVGRVGLVQAVPLPFNNTLFNTGVDSSGLALPDGTLGDPHYSLVSVPGGTTDILVRNKPPVYPIPPYLLYGDAISAWIGPNGTGCQYDPNCTSTGSLFGPPGTYDYRTTFNLTGLNSGTAAISGLWNTDNNGLGISINGVDTGVLGTHYTTGFTQFLNGDSPFSITSGFKSGVNTLDFFVNNGGSVPNPTALKVEMTGTAAIPEPETYAMLLVGLGLIGFTARRKKDIEV